MITSDGGLLAYRELYDVFALTTTGGERLAEARTGTNRQHLLVGLLRQSVFGRLAGYEDVNDAERLCHDPAMRWVGDPGSEAELCPLRNTYGFLGDGMMVPNRPSVSPLGPAVK